MTQLCIDLRWIDASGVGMYINMYVKNIMQTRLATLWAI